MAAAFLLCPRLALPLRRGSRLLVSCSAASSGRRLRSSVPSEPFPQQEPQLCSVVERFSVIKRLFLPRRCSWRGGIPGKSGVLGPRDHGSPYGIKPHQGWVILIPPFLLRITLLLSLFFLSPFFCVCVAGRQFYLRYLIILSWGWDRGHTQFFIHFHRHGLVVSLKFRGTQMYGSMLMLVLWP